MTTRKGKGTEAAAVPPLSRDPYPGYRGNAAADARAEWKARQMKREAEYKPQYRGLIIMPKPCTKHGPGLPGTRCPCSMPCPECDAKPGTRCKRPSEHEAPDMHVRRAVAAEFVDSLCGHAYTVSDYTSRHLHVPPFALKERPKASPPACTDPSRPSVGTLRRRRRSLSAAPEGTPFPEFAPRPPAPPNPKRNEATVPLFTLDGD